MARLIEYATNSSNGETIHITADLDGDQLTVTTHVEGLNPVAQAAQVPRRAPGRPPKGAQAG